MIVATAGHIDHGKTRLVKALTGVDTDRLPEERVRGISIELGFAHADLGGRERISFIDVPGHERFIRTMLAGVSGIDAALLVVAADDGVMPQTREHLQILDLLDVRRGAVVVTKTDLVPPRRHDAVAEDIRAILGNTSLECAEIFPVSTVTGEGLSALSQWLRALCSQPVPPLPLGQYFRMPVDRAFTMPGSGTVVTGTVQSGEVAVGDHLTVSPYGTSVRIRAIQVQGSSAPRAGPGQRCALNLVGASVGQVGRGECIVHPDLHAPTNRIDARLKVLASAGGPISHWTPVHLHVGTADVSGRIAVPGEGAIEPGSSAFVQLVTDRPLATLHGDRFVVRDQSARRTMGGGVVLDPFAPKRKRNSALRTAELQAYERRSPAGVLAGLLELSESGVDLHAFARRLNLAEDSATAVLLDANAMVLGRSQPIGISRGAGEALTVRLLAELRAFHAGHPQANGIEIATLRKLLAPKLFSPAFHAFVRELASRQLIILSNDVARLPEHQASNNPEDDQLWFRVEEALRRLGTHTPLLGELATTLQIKEQTLRDFLYRKSRTGEVRRIAGERFCLRTTLARLAATAALVAQRHEDGFFVTTEFRDAIGTGRGLAIHYLEFFDQLGITQRFGDRRRLAKDFVAQLGAGEPFYPAAVSAKESP